MLNVLKKIFSGINAGICICIGGSIFLSLKSGSAEYSGYLGAILFSVALLCICLKGYSLFTGKIGFIPEKHGKEEISVLLLGLLGNAVATIGFGKLLRYAIPTIGDMATKICTAKLDLSIASTFIRALFCGILMYLAVSIFRENKTIVGILFCIPVFILCGFEHSIADMYYFAASDIVSWEAFGFLWNVILGNAVGAMILPVFNMIGAKKNEQ